MLSHPTPISYKTMLEKVKIRLKDLHKTLGARKVLNGVTLDVRETETMVILGGSGAGKSVTLKHIVRLMDADEGTVTVDGTIVTTATPAKLYEVRRKIGYLFQGGALLNSMNVFDNVALPLREHEVLSRDEIRDRVMTKLELVHLADDSMKMPSELSGGMKKRAGLARAIVREPEIILYDEPTAGLDPVIATKINDLILELKEKLKVTSVVVTHDMSSCFKVASRIAMLVDGTIHKLGTPAEMKASEDPIVQQFIYGDSEGPLTRRPKE